MIRVLFLASACFILIGVLLVASTQQAPDPIFAVAWCVAPPLLITLGLRLMGIIR